MFFFFAETRKCRRNEGTGEKGNKPEIEVGEHQPGRARCTFGLDRWNGPRIDREPRRSAWREIRWDFICIRMGNEIRDGIEAIQCIDGVEVEVG